MVAPVGNQPGGPAVGGKDVVNDSPVVRHHHIGESHRHSFRGAQDEPGKAAPFFPPPLQAVDVGDYPAGTKQPEDWQEQAAGHPKNQHDVSPAGLPQGNDVVGNA